MGRIQLEPQIMPGADAFDSSPGDPDEEERRRRELGASILADLSPDDPAAQEAERRQRQVDLADPIDGALPGAMVSTPQAPESQRAAVARGATAASAERPVGAAYRAAGGQPAPSSERVAPQRGHAGTQRILTFDPEVRTGQPPAAVRVDDSRTQGAASPVQASAGRALGSPASSPASGVSPSQPSGPAASSPSGGVDRARLLELARAKTGGGADRTREAFAALDEARRQRLASARVRQLISAPLEGIGRGLMMAAGVRPAGGYANPIAEAEAISANDRAAAQQAMGTESRMREQSAAQQRAAEEAAARREDRVADRELRAQGVASLDRYRQQMADLRRQADEGLISQRQAAAEAIRLRAEREQAMEDPESELSRSEQQAFAQYVAGLPVQMRNMLGDIDVSQMNGRQVQETWRAYERHLGTVRHTGRPRSGTSGGGGNPLRRTAPAWWSGSDDEWRALGATGQRQEIQRHARSGGEDEQGTEIMPGVRSPMDLPASEAQSMRNGIAQAGASAANIRGLGSVHQRYGGLSARISREAEAEITPRLVVASGMVANLGNTGTINESEVPRINAALPNPADLQQMTFGTFQRRMETWQNLLESGVRSQLAARGVDDAGIRRVLQTIRTGSFSAGGGGGQRAQQPPANTLRVRRPDGSTGTIPRRLEQQARDRGWEVLDG